MILLITALPSSSSSNILIIISGISILALRTDTGTKCPEQERDPTADQRHKEEDHASPLVPTGGIHLFGKEHDDGTPDTPDKGLGRERAGRLVLVAVDEVVVGGVVQEDEAEADGETADGGADPVYARVGGPGEDEQTHGDEPAGAHHGDESVLGWGFAVEAGGCAEVVFVDKWGTGGGGYDTYGERNLEEKMNVSIFDFMYIYRER